MRVAQQAALASSGISFGGCNGALFEFTCGRLHKGVNAYTRLRIPHVSTRARFGPLAVGRLQFRAATIARLSRGRQLKGAPVHDGVAGSDRETWRSLRCRESPRSVQDREQRLGDRLTHAHDSFGSSLLRWLSR